MSSLLIKPITYQYPELISKIEQGLIKIPAFQREFIWPIEKTLLLLDSIVRHYPIGSFLFWQTSDFLNSVRDIGGLPLASVPEGHPVQYVLNGQQRITSLYAALKSATIDEYQYEISVDLDSTDESESVFDTEEPDDAQFVSLSDLLSVGDHVRATSRSKTERGTPELFTRSNRSQTRIALDEPS